MTSQEETTTNNADAQHQALLANESRNAVASALAAVKTARAKAQRSHPDDTYEELDGSERNLRAYILRIEALNI